jgi:hypothetical protein
MLRSVEWLITDVSEQPICPIFGAQAVQEESFNLTPHFAQVHPGGRAV